MPVAPSSMPRVLCLIGTSALLLSGCATPQGKFVTQDDPTHPPRPLGKVLIAYYAQPPNVSAIIGRHFSEQYVDRLTAALAARDISFEKVRLEVSDLDRNRPLQDAMALHSPDQLLSFSIMDLSWHAGVERLWYGDLTRYRSDLFVTLELSIADTQANQTVWRTTASYYVLPRPQDAADQFVEQLVEAGLLKPAKGEQ